MPAEIRKARASDVDDLAAIEKAVFTSDRISRRSFRLLIERETAETLVAESDGRVAGYAVVLFRKGSGVARLYSLATGPFFSGLGIGRQLLAAATSRMRTDGFADAVLWVLRGNAVAERFYALVGWRRDGAEREEQPYGVVSNVVRMRRAING